MADWNPIRLWRNILALPNESRTKTIAVAFLASIVCAAMVTGATVILRPIQAQNRAMEQQARLEALLAEIPGLSEILAGSDEAALSTVVVDLPRGEAATEVTPENLADALGDSANWTELSPQEDIAGLGSRADLKQIYLLRGAEEEVELVILPISGTGVVNGVSLSGAEIYASTNGVPGVAQPITGYRTLTEFNGNFTVSTATALVGSELDLTLQLWTAPPGSDVFAPVPGAICELAPSLTGVVAVGDQSSCSVTGLSIPLDPGSRAILVSSMTASGVTLVNTLDGYVSAGLTLSEVPL